MLILDVNTQCSPIGTNNQTRFTAVTNHGFYLNTAYPAPCSGTVQKWRYCRYQPSDTNGNNYRATLAVYRRVGSGDEVRYERVSSVFTASMGRRQIRSQRFSCHNLNVPDFTIEAGDYVGACIYDPIDNDRVRRQLDIVGQTSGYSLMQMNDVSECGDNSMPSNISSSLLSTVNSRILHLYATITGLSKTCISS